MGLFTNRKRDEDLDGLSEAASLLAQFNSPADEHAGGVNTAEPAPTEHRSDPVAGFLPSEPMTDFFSVEAVDEAAAAPIAETSDFFAVAAFPTFFSEEPTVAPLERRLEDRPRAQAGNVEIDASGLLDMLGVAASAELIDISEAHQRFLADHQPSDSDDADAASIKEAIRREANTAYASFRLTHAA